MLNLETFTGRFEKRQNPSETPVRKCAADIDSYYKLHRCGLLTKHPKVLNLKSVSIFIMVTYLIGVFCI